MTTRIDHDTAAPLRTRPTRLCTRPASLRTQPTSLRTQPTSLRTRPIWLRRAALALTLATGFAVPAHAGLPAIAEAPLPFGTAVTPDETLLFRTNADQGTVSVVDLVPGSASFLREIAEIDVGRSPQGIDVSPDGQDVLVANLGSDSISIIDVATLAVRKTLTSARIDKPFDIVLGARESLRDGIAFGSGTYHGFVSNLAADSVIVYESGPDGPAGIGFDDIIGAVREPQDVTLVVPMLEPRGAALDPDAPLDAFADTVGGFVAHTTLSGHGAASRFAYTADESPGPNVLGPAARPTLRGKTFEVTQQFVSTHGGAGLDVALADEHLSVADPTRLYLSMTGGVVDVFDVDSGVFLERLQFGQDVTDLSTILLP